ncbi:MAG: DUF4159 domain-containing protein [Planctomycetes bacterium]|nr:DUF4159 domain-containing protein [Planctomycetota bacterium]
MKRSLLSLAALLCVLTAALAAENDGHEDRPGVVRCANLIYGDNKSSVCFSDHFLADVQQRTNIWTAQHFDMVRMESEDLFAHPFAVMSGNGEFTFTEAQRKSLKQYLAGGGFLLASAGCSAPEWNESFRREIGEVFPDLKLEPIPFKHPIFHTVYDINELPTKSRSVQATLYGLTINGRIAVVFSPEGLNDTANAGGNCCCCGGNEVKVARQVNVNLLVYAVSH